MSDLDKTANLLRLVRLNMPGGQISGLSVEILLLVAQGPKTIEQLVKLTGANNGTVCRAALTWCVWWDRKREEVRKPVLPLLQRRKRPRLAGHRYHLTKTGLEFLKAAGFYSGGELS